MSRNTDDISTSWRTSDADILEVRACTRMATLMTRSPMRSRSVVDFKAGKQLAGPRFIDARNGCRQALVDLALDQVEFFLAILDGEKGHAGRIGEQVADVEGGVASDQAGFQGQTRQIIGPAKLRLGAVGFLAVRGRCALFLSSGSFGTLAFCRGI